MRLCRRWAYVHRSFFCRCLLPATTERVEFMPESSSLPATGRRRWWPWVLLLLVLALIGWGMARSMWQRQSTSQALVLQTAPTAAVLQVPAAGWMALQARALTQGLPVSGSLSAVHHARVKARVAGELQALAVREGDTVHKGQVLAKVDATDAQARYQQAKLQADAAQANVAIQQRQYDNQQALVGRGFISATALEATASQLQAAQANHAAARAAQDASRKVLDDTVLYSPLDGHVARRLAEPGERVGVDMPVLEIVDLRDLELEVALPPNDAWHVQVGQTAQLALTQSSAGAAEPQFSATVARINPAAQAGSRSLPAYLRIAQSASTQMLRPGMYVHGSIALGQATGLAVPLAAVYTDQPVPYLQVVRNGMVEHLPVTLGARSVSHARADGMENTPLAGDMDVQAWVLVQGVPADTPVLLPLAGAVPAGTAVVLQSAATAPVASVSSTSPTTTPQ